MLNSNLEIYTAESRAKNWQRVFKAMMRGLIQGRYLAYRLFIKEIKADYIQSRLGILWDFLEPIVLAVIFVVLRQGNAISSIGELMMPYTIFVVYGLLLWQSFSEALTLPLTIMQRNKTLLTQVKIPPEGLLLALVYKCLFNGVFRILVMIGLGMLLGTWSLTGWFKFLLLYPTIILVGLAFGLLLAPFNVFYKDVSRLVNISLRPLLYASPVIFYVPTIPILAIFYKINPAAVILVNLRLVAVQNTFVDLPIFVITIVLLLMVFIMAWFIFHLSVPILSDKL